MAADDRTTGGADVGAAPGTAARPQLRDRMGLDDRVAHAAVLVQTAVLAVLELFFLPLRLDGTLLPAVGGWPFPISVVVAAVSMPLLVIAASSCSRKMSVAASPLLVWLGVLLVLGVFGPGGDVVLANDWRTLALFGAGALPGAVALGAIMGRPA
ncbi:hypothetical protein [Actinosynnema sp.]|uniref:hypothetical protein n=1 Tax=Actinosynnema sp. TaxID=1872144 RepID=UPI003F84AF05